jgi:DNA-binding CsgD family transcriptional regulator
MESVGPVVLSDGIVQLDPVPGDTDDGYRWFAQRLSDSAAVGYVGLGSPHGHGPQMRTWITMDVSWDSPQAQGLDQARAQALRLVCQWAFASVKVSAISWQGATQPVTHQSMIRAAFNDAGFRMHPFPQRSVIEGPDGLLDAWYADLLPDDSRTPSHRNLTPREHNVLAGMAQGLSNSEIAHELGISEYTVKNHVRSILDALQTPSRTAAVVLALQSGLISLAN